MTVPLAHLPTPLEAADRLAAALDMAEGSLLVKRDDCTGLAGGGNKARKLVHLCADAVAQGCDTLVTGGGRQSNHVRMTAAAANKLGLAATIVLAADPGPPTGNVTLDMVLAPDIVWGGPLDYYALEARIEAEADRLRAAGRRPYLIPIGGASPVGEQGYVEAADEIVTQLGVRPDLVVTADGSGGTHAGLVAGFGDHDLVLGVDVGTRPDLDEQVPAKAAAAAAHAGRPAPVGDCAVDHSSFGAGYGAPTDECRAALDLAARTEGLVLDPVYSGKAMVGLVSARRAGRIGRHDRVVFLHTGGLPALFSPRYSDWIATPPR
jgi:1-aminocyclopropane-1-carboxylate deaminase/D-cysteine desulfhydrase-like pyridoxal-dependent ACC family enzyme